MVSIIFLKFFCWSIVQIVWKAGKSTFFTETKLFFVDYVSQLYKNWFYFIFMEYIILSTFKLYWDKFHIISFKFQLESQYFFTFFITFLYFFGIFYEFQIIDGCDPIDSWNQVFEFACCSFFVLNNCIKNYLKDSLSCRKSFRRCECRKSISEN